MSDRKIEGFANSAYSTSLVISQLTTNIHSPCYYTVHVYVVFHFLNCMWSFGVKANQSRFFKRFCFYMYCRWRTNYQERIGIPLTGLTLQHLCACPKSDFQHHMSWSISRFNDLMREVIVRFVDIDEIVDHNFLFITLIKGDRAIMMWITYNMLTQ